MSDDPFERAVEKERENLRRGRPDTRRMLRVASLAYFAFLLGWAVMLFIHYRYWPNQIGCGPSTPSYSAWLASNLPRSCRRLLAP